ncbi:MAG: hypothetical protein CSA05_00180 [Bacteroidia bacterium]|nr:MAG: hypothetical protein CSA05_00180 [Bacteroidia bacterium]
MNKIIQLTILCLCGFSLFSQNEVVQIDTIFLHKDDAKKLILINKDVAILNTEYPNLKNRILSAGLFYDFSSPVTELETGNSYAVTDQNKQTYKLYFTQLPIVSIDTSEAIVDEPRVYAEFALCESNGNFIQNNIGIEYRGGSTQAYPKKSLRIEFWKNKNGDDTKNISLLNMRSDDDWNLQAMYNEPLRMRTKICFELWNKIDTLYYLKDETKAINGVRQKFVELFVSNEYRGVYALSERIDKKQLRLKKFKNGEIKGELYKGKEWGGATTFSDLPPYDNNKDFWGGYRYIYPKDTTSWENLYNFVDFVINAKNADFYENYTDKFKIDNAVNYFIFMNLLRAKDNTGKNLFVAKYKKDKPYFYVPWDLDATLGINWTGEQDNISNDLISNKFYRRLILDTLFTDKLKVRWNHLRETVISTNSILALFRDYYNYLNKNGVYERELLAWNEYDFDYDGNIQYLTNWVENRIIYLDNIFNRPKLLRELLRTRELTKVDVKIYPNPASNTLRIRLGSKHKIENISILNLLGSCILSCNSTNIDVSNLDKGIYFVIINLKNSPKLLEKLIIER